MYDRKKGEKKTEKDWKWVEEYNTKWYEIVGYKWKWCERLS